MSLLIYLTAGVVVGYVAGRIMQTNSWLGLLTDIITSMVGAFLAGYFISPLLGIGTISAAVTISTMLVSLTGSVVMIWIVKAVHREPDNADRPVPAHDQMNRLG
jgi:uncharacterized membrane protein YeaQ/YmgE (transglycosylase-associated protein family)